MSKFQKLAQINKIANECVQDGDFLLCFWGFAQEPVAQAHPDLIAVEPGIGYHTGIFSSYKIFESYSVRDIAYEKAKLGNPQWYDAIIPNYFDPAHFDKFDKCKNI